MKDFFYLFDTYPLNFTTFDGIWGHLLLPLAVCDVIGVPHPPPTLATMQLPLSMSLFHCFLVALYLLLPIDLFTLRLHHLHWPLLAVANGIFPISHVIDADPFTLAPNPLPLVIFT